ncbi:MAG TPA: zinc-binding dehydrogenase [Burkholderiaceae bacterium]|nr:zinc-binding dehydrogenase [Burkholderiaceae bacterium]
MTPTPPRTGLQLRSLVKPDGELEVSLVETELPALAPDEVLIRIEATPINPSDLGLLFGPADLGTLRFSGSDTQPVVTAQIPERAMRVLSQRIGQSMPVGNEGAGVVVAAGESPAAQALLGKTVAAIGGAMYSQYRSIPVDQCLVLPDGTPPIAGASCFVNPLTSLGMTETMRLEGHKAIVHTAAASNLGRMLNRICITDGIGLVNIVRRPEQEALLRAEGARYVCNSSSPDFLAELTDALAATGATIAFDAIGGGKLAGQILGCMEAAVNRTATEYSRYGSNVHKQVYLYGNLDLAPTEISRGFGMAWGVGGWLLFPFLNRVGPERTRELKQRVVNELKTTFASDHSHEVSLAGALKPEAIADYSRRATQSKYLILPNRA